MDKLRLQAAEKIYRHIRLAGDGSKLTVDQAAWRLTWQRFKKHLRADEAASLVMHNGSTSLPAISISDAVRSDPDVSVTSCDSVRVRVSPTELASSVILYVLERQRSWFRPSLVHDYRGVTTSAITPSYFSKRGEGSNMVTHIKGGARKERILVEYSSPNIAKPFHMGHLRSTLIGNTLSNVLKETGKSVTRINYLGDWGTQFGYLLLGYERYGDQQKLVDGPIGHLEEVYVSINQFSSEEAATETHAAAKAKFCQLEAGEEEAMRQWNDIVSVTKGGFLEIYKILNIEFDSFESESMYRDKTKLYTASLEERGLLKYKDGVGIVSLKDYNVPDVTEATVLKSDGSSLYLTRDLCALDERMAKYAPDRLLYVVEQGQRAHFQHLSMVGHLTESVWWDRLTHVPFGRVAGMSTRKGTAVHVVDLIAKTRQTMLQMIKTSKTTKSECADMEAVALQLAISGMVIHDLKRNRLSEYFFNMEEALRPNGESGPLIQYSHARLCSLEQTFGLQFDPSEVSFQLLVEDEAIKLLSHLAGLDDVLREVSCTLQPGTLVRYMLDLSQLCRVAYNALPVKNQPTDVAEARLALFYCTRLTLASCLRLVGLNPMDKI